jgi:hypothetical protein
VSADDDDSGCCWGIRLFLSAVADVLAPQGLAANHAAANQTRLWRHRIATLTQRGTGIQAEELVPVLALSPAPPGIMIAH